MSQRLILLLLTLELFLSNQQLRNICISETRLQSLLTIVSMSRTLHLGLRPHPMINIRLEEIDDLNSKCSLVNKYVTKL